MAHTPPFRPPRMASWLVALVAPGEHAGSILGDLQEECSEIASRAGVTSARRWYWRQSVKTVAVLAVLGLRAAPWSIAAAALAGNLLLLWGASLPERVTLAVLQLGWHHVTPYYTWEQAQNYILWLGRGVWIGRLALPLLVGCLVAAAAKNREMVATLAVCVVWGASRGLAILSAGGWPEYPFLLPLLLIQFAHSVLLVTGGVILREIRSMMARRPAKAV